MTTHRTWLLIAAMLACGVAAWGWQANGAKRPLVIGLPNCLFGETNAAARYRLVIHQSQLNRWGTVWREEPLANNP